MNGEAYVEPDRHKMANSQWKSGTLVKLNSTELVMTVIGYDSVGSVICEWHRDGQPARGYVTAAVLALVDNQHQSAASQ